MRKSIIGIACFPFRVRSRFSDILLPDFGVFADIFREQVDAFARVEVNHLGANLAQPLDSSLKVYRLSHDHRSYAKLANQSAAIPARGEGRDHDFVAIGALTAGAAKRVGFAVRRGITFLHSAIIAFAQELALVRTKS